MRFKTRAKQHIALESVAVTDIVMNLFLFFFITFSLIATFGQSKLSALKVDLPAVTSGKIDLARNEHEILLTRKGDLLWDHSPIQMADLEKKLQDEKIKSERVLLISDKHASVQSLVRVLQLVRDSGAKNVVLQTKVTKNNV